MKTEWEWGYYGRCFIDNKYAFGVRIHRNHDGSFDGQVFNSDGTPEPTGLMLNTLDRSKTLSEAMVQCELEAKRIVESKTKPPTLERLKRDFEEYPFHNGRSR